MEKLSDFRIKDMLYLSKYSEVYRAHWISKDKPVVIKMLRGKPVTPEQIARFEYEYQITQKAAVLSDSINVYTHTEEHNRRFLVLEDFGANPIIQFYQNQRVNLNTWLKHAITIAQALLHIHELKIVHKDINPANILYAANSGIIKLIDYGNASTLSRETPELRNPDKLEGTLAYIAPEQTGRLNRGIDYRCDFYSLGITFYELLTGSLPFNESNSMDLIYDHLAKTPIPPHQLQPEIPQPISAIIMKLVEKDPDNRYQSEASLIRDLSHCYSQWQKRGKIASFAIAQQDIPSRFKLPDKLYGREPELQQLRRSLDALQHGQNQITLIAGSPGIGKSSLINQFNQPQYTQNALFISGKCEQLQQNLPYLALDRAFTELTQHYLTQTNQHIKQIKSDILAALGTNAQVLVDVFPALGVLLGKQPPVAKLEPKENYNRFILLFQRLLSAITSTEQPLILFLDDLQWANTALLNLIQLIVCSDNLQHIYVIGAYRDNEIDDYHPLRRMTQAVAKENRIINTIELRPLAKESVNQLIADALFSTTDQTQKLTDVCLQKTQGNPFFLGQFLTTLVDKEHIRFQTQQGHWAWDLEKILHEQVADNVVSFLQEKIRLIPRKIQKLLKLAACIGMQFNLDILAKIYEETIAETANDLKVLLENNFIIPLSQQYKYLDRESIIQSNYRFQHDRLLQAAYSLLEGDSKAPLHLKIGKLYLEQLEPDTADDSILNIAEHFNKISEHQLPNTDRGLIINVSLQAGNYAQSVLAYQTALHYYHHGIKLLKLNYWDTIYNTCVDLYTGAIQAANLTGEHQRVLELTATLDKKAKNPLDLVPAYISRVQTYIFMNQLKEAIASIIPLLHRLKFHAYTAKPSWLQVAYQFIKTQISLVRLQPESLISLPKMSNERIEAAILLIESVTSAAYLSSMKHLLLGILLVMPLIKKHGLSKRAENYIAGYGLILTKFNLTSAKRYAQTAVTIAENSGDHIGDYGPTYFAYYQEVMPCFTHIKETIKPRELLVDQLFENGNIEYAGWMASSFCSHLLETGRHLQHIYDTSQEMLRFTHTNKQAGAYIRCLSYAIFCKKLISPSKQGHLLDYQQYKESMLLQYAEKDKLFLSGIYHKKSRLAYIFNDYTAAAEFSTKSLEWPSTNHFDKSCIRFCYLLSSLKQYPNVSQIKKLTILAKTQIYRHLFRRWSKYCEANYLHRYYLISAEYFRVIGSHNKAERYFDLAIQNAQKHNFLNNQAIACEQAAEYYINQHRQIGRYYLYLAYDCYQQWGALAKTAQLAKRHPRWMQERLAHTKAEHFRKSQPIDIAPTDEIIQAIQTLTGEILIDKLATKIVHTLSDMTQFEKIVLILKQKQVWKIIAGVDEKHLFVTPHQSKSLTDCASTLPSELLIEWLKEKKSLFVQQDMPKDDYFNNHQPYCLIGQPLINQGELIGFIYLENNHPPPTPLGSLHNTLKQLASALALSIRNALFYQRIFHLNQAYERFVPKKFLSLMKKDDITDIQIGDYQTLNMSLLFLKIENFVTLCEQEPLPIVYSLMETIYATASRIIKQHRGFVDKYYGNNLFVTFPHDPQAALQACILLQQEFNQWNEQQQERQQPLIHYSLGLHFGTTLLCTIGDKGRMDGTVIADAVNIAARVQELAPRYHSQLLTTAAFLQQFATTPFNTRPVDRVILRGKTQVTELIEVIDGEAAHERTLKLQTLNLYLRGWQAYLNADFQAAIQAFRAVLQQHTNDSNAQRLLLRCEYLLQHPPQQWDGVLAEKDL